MRQSPGQLGVHLQIKHAAAVRQDDFLVRKAIKTHEPVSLVQPVLAQQRRGLQGQIGRSIGDGAKGRVVHAPQARALVEVAAGAQNSRIAGTIGPHNHLRALSARCIARRFGPAHALLGQGNHGMRGLLLALLPGCRYMPSHIAHGGLNLHRIFLGCQLTQALLGRQLDIDAEPVGITARQLQQLRRGVWNRLEMDIAAKVVVFAQAACHFHQLLHGVVAGLNDAAGQKQSFYAVAAIEVQRQLHHLVCREARALHVRAFAVDAIAAVVDAEVGQQYLEQRDTASVRRIAVTDAHAFG